MGVSKGIKNLPNRRSSRLDYILRLKNGKKAAGGIKKTGVRRMTVTDESGTARDILPNKRLKYYDPATMDEKSSPSSSLNDFSDIPTPRTTGSRSIQMYGPERVVMPDAKVLDLPPPHNDGCCNSNRWCGKPSLSRTYSLGKGIQDQVKAFAYKLNGQPGFRAEMQKLLLVTYTLAKSVDAV